MWSILIGLAVAALILGFIARRYQDIADIAEVSAGVLVFVTIAVPIVLGLTCMPLVEEITTEVTDIVGLKRESTVESNVHSDIFATSVLIGGRSVYVSYKVTDGGYACEHIPARDTVVYEDTEDGGYIVARHTDLIVDPDWKAKYLHWLVFFRIDGGGQTEYEIHVPEGTVVQGFGLD